MKKSIYNAKIYFVVLLSVVIFNYGCSDGVSVSNLNLFSISDDVNLGAQVVTEMHQDQANYPILNNPNATAYVQNIMNQIIQSPLVNYREQFNYQVTIIDTETINAFALPGGYIHVYKGLLKYLDNEATLAAILAHEVAHAERRHATKRMTKAYGASVLLGFLLGNNPSQIEEIAANLASGLGFLYNSREDEYEADEYSFKYLQSTVWYPGAGKFFFEKIGSESNNSAFAELFSTHPLDQKRIDALNKLIADAKLTEPSENNVFTQRYIQFKNTLQ
ncbi:MAG: M48 family metalloprotease [Candidatus Kapabacteria bacterium]|nr:M48 family metalloprotease [Ignavibacteriota bacterium]MCW5885515.1 M48 family metalloprotease [Candidatus Kapabacteria bacterium]